MMPPPSLPPPLSVRSSDNHHSNNNNLLSANSTISIPSLPATLAMPPGTPLSQQAPATPSTVGVEPHAQPVLQ